MRSTVLYLADLASAETSLRVEAIADLVARMEAIGGAEVDRVTATADPEATLAGLAAEGQLIRTGDELHYAPSRAARDRVAGNEDGAWPKAVASRHAKQVRQSNGAVYHFPLENVGTAAPGGTDRVDAFVTEWTGLPAAGAIAVHPAHPLSKGLPEGVPGVFTGRYCRHPLTGDLLPIWVADWVKPEFGTGAVLVNPGHNRIDLEFSRAVGLGVRFSLEPPDGSWVEPPFIRSGSAVRSGIADGLPFDQAGNAYIRAVLDRGLAELRTDHGFGTFPVAGIGDSGSVEVALDPDRRTVTGRGDSEVRVRLHPSPVLAVLDSGVREANLIVVAPSAQVEGALLALRLLLAEPVEPAAKAAPRIVLVGNTVVTPTDAELEVRRLAHLVGVAPGDTSAPRAQQLEACERFVTLHRQLVTREASGDRYQAAPDVLRSAVQVKGLLARYELKQAFTQLYRLQKNVAGAPDGAGDLALYWALAHVATGLDVPESFGTLQATWSAL